MVFCGSDEMAADLRTFCRFVLAYLVTVKAREGFWFGTAWNQVMKCREISEWFLPQLSMVVHNLIKSMEAFSYYFISTQEVKGSASM